MQPPQKSPSLRPLKQRKSLGEVLGSCLGDQIREGKGYRLPLLLTYSFILEIFTATRQEEVAGISEKFSDKIPIRFSIVLVKRDILFCSLKKKKTQRNKNPTMSSCSECKMLRVLTHTLGG